MRVRPVLCRLVVVAAVIPAALGCTLFLDTSGLDTGSADGAAPDAGDSGRPSRDAEVDHHVADVTRTTVDAHETGAPHDAAGDVEARDVRTLSDATHDARPPTDAHEERLPDALSDAFSVPILAKAQGASDSSMMMVASSTTPLDQDVLAHDAIIVAFNIDGALTPSQVTDTLGNSYAKVVGPAVAYGTNSYIYVAADIAGGADSVTVTLSGVAMHYFEVFVQEYSGLATSNPFDKGSSSSGTSLAVDGMVSGFVTTTFPYELIFAYGWDGIAVAGTGFTQTSNFEDDLTEGRVVTSIGMYQATATMTQGMEWQLVMATFRGQ
jgi:hypothetical protein